MKTKKSALKIALFSIIGVVCLALLVCAGYVLYVFTSYYRIEDNKVLEHKNPEISENISRGKIYKALTMNIGFGAYDDKFSFFMDTGYADAEGKVQIKGRQSRATDKEHVLTNVSSIIKLINGQDPDFILLQEVDEKSTRSYHVNEAELFRSSFADYAYTWAECFHSPYLFYPIREPHGKSTSGLMIFSEASIDSSIRRSLPLSESRFANLFDLDRCLVMNRYKIEGSDKEFVMIDAHLSAYDEGGKVRKKQVDFIKEILSAEHEKENYVVMGGDFNQVLTPGGENRYVKPNGGEIVPDWVASFDADFEGYKIYGPLKGDDGAEFGTARNNTMAFDPNWTYTVTIDGFVASDNIKVHDITIITSHAFKYSDHNPVVLEFELE